MEFTVNSLIALSSSGFPVEGSSLGFSGAFASSFFSVPADPAAAPPPWQMPFTSRNTAAVKDDPDKLPQIRQFMNYYLPTTLKLLNTYDRMRFRGGYSSSRMSVPSS